jgi:hypothetical protein
MFKWFIQRMPTFKKMYMTGITIIECTCIISKSQINRVDHGQDIPKAIYITFLRCD